MLTRRLFIISAAISAAALGAAGSARADDGAALAFVQTIYTAYKGENTKGVAIDTDAQLRRYFEPSLAALISKDRKDAARHHDVPTLDGDPFIDAQDWEIAAFDIAVEERAPGKASATVKFTNSGTPKTVVLDLVKLKNGWRIGEIAWRRKDKNKTLREIFRQ